VPDVLPVLSRGKHRSPKRGACFMEMASYLAGERWSDHPACTHPLLADVARNVNDRTTDAGRPLLAPMIPAVIGLTTDDPRADARLALHCALVALPVAAAERQRSLAVGVLSCERVLHRLGDAQVSERSDDVLAAVPDAALWAERFTTRTGIERDTSVRRFRRNAAPGIVNLAARSVAEAVTPNSDALLRTMLEGAIDEGDGARRPGRRAGTGASVALAGALRADVVAPLRCAAASATVSESPSGGRHDHRPPRPATLLRPADAGGAD
jgi:hypothetical protein